MLIMLLISLNVKAQNNYSAVAEVNYNTFSHNDLSDFQQQLLKELNEIDMRVNDDFGANIGFTVGVKVEEINTLYFLSYNSTGGKISYSDYSGVIRVTQLLQAYTFGGEYQFRVSEEDSRNTFFLGARGFMNVTSFDVESYSMIYDNVTTESIEFDSFDFGLGARLIYEIPVWLVKLKLNAGYDLVFAGDLILSEDKEYALEDNKGDRIKTGWSGFRTGIGIVVPF